MMPKLGLLLAALITGLGFCGFLWLSNKAISSENICLLHRIEVSKERALIECFERDAVKETAAKESETAAE